MRLPAVQDRNCSVLAERPANPKYTRRTVIFHFLFVRSVPEDVTFMGGQG